MKGAGKIGVWLCVTVCMVSSCKEERGYFPKDIEPAAIQIARFDSALIAVGEYEDIREGIRRLKDTYPAFTEVFCEEIIGIPLQDTTALEEALEQFLQDTIYGFKQTNEEVIKTFKDISRIRERIDKGFGRIKYLYPTEEMPEIVFFISGFNASLFFWDENKIAVGTDMYLGSDYPYYNRVVYNYQKQTMRPACIPADIISAYLFRKVPFTSEQGRLLENMLYRGKVMYLLSVVLPEEPEYEIMGYTKEQWDWAVRNEAAIWQMMIDKHDLFKTEGPLLTSYLNDGPFTSEISQEAPARLGTWIGWRIAKSYMAHNSEVTLQELMEEGDAQKILEKSYYRPR